MEKVELTEVTKDKLSEMADALENAHFAACKGLLSDDSHDLKTYIGYAESRKTHAADDAFLPHKVTDLLNAAADSQRFARAAFQLSGRETIEIDDVTQLNALKTILQPITDRSNSGLKGSTIVKELEKGGPLRDELENALKQLEGQQHKYGKRGGGWRERG